MSDTTELGQPSALLPKALRLAHDDLRARLVVMMLGGGPVMIAAKRLAQLCLPHFEWEEETLMPVLNLLPDLLLGKLDAQMAKVMPLIEEFNIRQADMDNDHMLILSAIELLSRVALRTKNADCAAFAATMKIHESVEDQVIYPLVTMIGNHLRENAAN